MIELSEAPRENVTVQGLIFSAAKPYEEGHALTAIEAGVMNNTRIDNIRNNFAHKVRKSCEDAKVEKSHELSDEIKKLLQVSFTDFEEGYEFGTRQGGREADPVRREAMEMATKAVKDQLRKMGHKLSDVGAEKIRELSENAIETKPAFTARATEIVAARNAAADELTVDLE
jgi:hypothetical protein